MRVARRWRAGRTARARLPLFEVAGELLMAVARRDGKVPIPTRVQLPLRGRTTPGTRMWTYVPPCT